MTTDYVSPRYLSCAETAKLVRAALKKAFPGFKFSVRSHSYAGGASIDIHWTDGPTAKAVDQVVGVFSGADFDGMIDMKTHNTSWLNPDGSAHVAHAQGTEGSRGYLPEVIADPSHPQAVEVRFGADHVMTHRSISDEWTTEILDHFEKVIGRPIDRTDKWGMWSQQVPLAVDRSLGSDEPGKLLHMVEHCTEDLSTVFHQFTGARVGGDLT